MSHTKVLFIPADISLYNREGSKKRKDKKKCSSTARRLLTQWPNSMYRVFLYCSWLVWLAMHRDQAIELDTGLKNSYGNN